MKVEGVFNTLYLKEKDMLQLVFFDIQVLERYWNNPKYLVFYNDYRGSIVIDDKFLDFESSDNFEYLKDFGMAYNKNNRNKRAIVAFVGDLISLPNKMQSHFYSYLLENQGDYLANNSFIKNLILGEWVDTISIFQALLMEMHYINEMCNAMGLVNMFKKEFDVDSSLQNERPSNYHSILLPTEKNYYDFIITLEKMITGNLNVKIFTTKVANVYEVERKFKNGSNKGTLTLLVEWLKLNIRGANIDDDVEKPLRELVSQRQKPAHVILDNNYDEDIWMRQDDFMKKIYVAIRNIRLLFANHPKAKSVVIPQIIFDGEHIEIY